MGRGDLKKVRDSKDRQRLKKSREAAVALEKGKARKAARKK